jgi:hypothetical protein
MKKIFILGIVILMLVLSFSTVFAGGGQVQGDKGEGNTHENFENGCETQPCFDMAERPQIGKP